jgi:hypothetical protein
MQSWNLIIGVLFLGVFLGVCVFSAGRKGVTRTALFAAVGYIGAGLFYGYLLGLDSQTRLTCPVCPNISSSGENLSKFVWRTLLLGTVNAFCFIAAGWLVAGIIHKVRPAQKNATARTQND